VQYSALVTDNTGEEHLFELEAKSTAEAIAKAKTFFKRQTKRRWAVATVATIKPAS
jgi:hypothetical protein